MDTRRVLVADDNVSLADTVGEILNAVSYTHLTLPTN